jgi:hypothetical protein
MSMHFAPGRAVLLVATSAALVLTLSAQSVSYPIVFVSRQIPRGGSIYWDVPDEMPGVGPRSRFRVAAPGKLIIREPSGSLRVLLDGSAPSAASLDLIDVNAPDVSYDGRTIVFAGLPAGEYGQGPVNNPGAWRIYTVRVDGTALRQVTTSSLGIEPIPGAAAMDFPYDDTDPAWLPDGRIVFSSTRWPAFAHYSGVRTSNLYVVNSDGSNLHRITAERNGADRPLVDPVTGKIVYARWWRNHRFPSDDMRTVPDPRGGYQLKDGLTTDRENHVAAPDMFRNAWHIATINPDGTGLAMWAGAYREEAGNHAYGGSFTPTGEFYANFFPMYNMTEASGFGGVRRYRRGPGRYTHVIGITGLTLDYVRRSNPTSYGIFRGRYAGEPAVLPDGRVIVSIANDVKQDYGLYVMNPDGGDLTRLYDAPGTTELRARPVMPRPLPPVIAERVKTEAALLPPGEAGPYDGDGTFTFDALNVYGNAPVDRFITSAPAVGSAARIRFFLDHQRTSPGSFPHLDWPILLEEAPIAPDGSVKVTNAPANLPLFEQLRSASNRVPLTRPGGAAHVAGMNFGKPGSVVRCIGCHAGHSMIPVPADPRAAAWSNIAPGAAISVSSTRDVVLNQGLTDRLVREGERLQYWTSRPGETRGQWAQLTFPVRVAVRTVRLYNPVAGGDANSSIAVRGASVRLFADPDGRVQVGQQLTGPLSENGTDVEFADIPARAVRVEIMQLDGTFYGEQVASLAEIEVIGKGLEIDNAVAARSPEMAKPEASAELLYGRAMRFPVALYRWLTTAEPPWRSIRRSGPER